MTTIKQEVYKICDKIKKGRHPKSRIVVSELIDKGKTYGLLILLPCSKRDHKKYIKDHKERYKGRYSLTKSDRVDYFKIRG